MEQEFYQRIDAKLKSILDDNVPELILRENRRLNEILKLKKGEKDFKKDAPKGEEGEEIIRNILMMKGYKVIQSKGGRTFDTIMVKNQVPCLFEIKTDFFCGLRPENENIALELRAWHKLGSLLITDARFIGYLIPRKDIMGFISTDKLQKIIKSEVIRIITEKLENKNLLSDAEQESIKSIKSDDFESSTTYSIIERYIDYLPKWYNSRELGYKIAPNSGDKESGGVNLLMPLEEFKKQFQILYI